MVERITNSIAKKLFLRILDGLREGCLQVCCPEQTYTFGDSSSSLQARIVVHEEDFFRRAILASDIGIGESFMAGEWTTPDLVSVVRLAIRNLVHIESAGRVLSSLGRVWNFLLHRRNRNTQAGSRKNIAHHYDLGNDFYRLFLDENLAYSCAFFERLDESLERAQIRKFDRICRKLQLTTEDHLLEIGTGWGGFAAYAASTYGCRVTTTTISSEQYAYARSLFQKIGSAGSRIQLLNQDYRNLRGSFDKLVSIEMFEAVGYENYDTFFGACDRLLQWDGSMLLQTITIKDQKFHQYRHESDWIKKYIFPGAELASLAGIGRSLARATQLHSFHMEDIGMHYAETLHEWRTRFNERELEVRRLGFDNRFVRMWDYYLAYCEAAFRERYISDVQMLLTKAGNPHRLLNEPASTPLVEQDWAISAMRG
jgi:cyclopropane-fatty-acyl-phospholipid synthase